MSKPLIDFAEIWPGPQAALVRKSGLSAVPPAPPIPIKDLEKQLLDLVVEQDDAIHKIVPAVKLYQAGLNPPRRPAGVYLLLGPTGTGKTATVEALAKVLHGSEDKVVRIDCGEFQMEHEVAKLIGAPPGYLGHRETTPLLCQARLNQGASDRCSLSVLLFDEIEKAAPSFQRILLGMFDKGSLTLGDATKVNFDKTIIFMTSNLGSREILGLLKKEIGFHKGEEPEVSPERLHAAALAATKRHFSIEFVNRIDAVVTYSPLSRTAIASIFDMQLKAIQDLILERMGYRSFKLRVTPQARETLIGEGVSTEYGARELKRVLQRRVLHPVASMVLEGKVSPGDTVIVRQNAGEIIVDVAAVAVGEIS